MMRLRCTAHLDEVRPPSPARGSAGPSWVWHGPGNVVRGLLQDTLVVPAVRAFGRPFCASAAFGLGELANPVVFVANHGSHLDAPAILAALPASIRHRTAVAAAEDYFYRNRLLGLCMSLGVGAFPFPRQGRTGVERAAALLADGWNVVLFPEGSRSPDGAQHLFRDGIGHLLLASDAAAVPVAIVGTQALWPRGRALPRPGPITLRLGTPWCPGSTATPREISTELGRQVAALASECLHDRG
ncbi:MAG TPA: lysophospholipid acyltransferase family protein [Chloroflexota bacterium]|nr:lysophospholipid acyltransferase family protein [Chloroflexota bacterium]